MSRKQPTLPELQAQLSESAAAENFLNSEIGVLFKKIASQKINRNLKDITSDKFKKDHDGYVIAVTELQAYQNILKSFQAAASPIVREKIQEKIDELENGE